MRCAPAIVSRLILGDRGGSKPRQVGPVAFSSGEPVAYATGSPTIRSGSVALSRSAPTACLEVTTPQSRAWRLRHCLCRRRWFGARKLPIMQLRRCTRPAGGTNKINLLSVLVEWKAAAQTGETEWARRPDFFENFSVGREAGFEVRKKVGNLPLPHRGGTP